MRLASPTRSVAALVIAALLVPIVAARDPQPPATDQQGATDLPDSRGAMPDADAVARELYQLQQSRGGSIVTDLPGPVPQPAAETEAEPSRRPAASGPPLVPQWSPHRDPSLRAAGPRPGEYEPMPVLAGDVHAPPGYAAPRLYVDPRPASARPLSKVDVLRESAVRLDATANLLETYDLYDQADALREASQSLREEARRLKGELDAG